LILLSDLQAPISTAIYGGDRSFKRTSTPSRLIFARSLPPPPPLYHHPLALDNSSITCQLVDEPLPSVEGCGLNYQRHCSLTSKDAAAPAPPLSKGMWVVQSRSTEDLEREDHEGGGQEVRCPCGASRKWATTNVVAHFLPSLPLRLTLTTLNPTDQPQRIDDPNDSGDVDAIRMTATAMTRKPASARAAKTQAPEFHLRREREIEAMLRG